MPFFYFINHLIYSAIKLHLYFVPGYSYRIHTGLLILFHKIAYCVLNLGWSFQALFIYILDYIITKTNTLQTKVGVILVQYRVSFGATE